MSKGFPKYKIIDKIHNIWLTWDIAWSHEEALEIAIACCLNRPGQPVKIVEIKDAEDVRP